MLYLFFFIACWLTASLVHSFDMGTPSFFIPNEPAVFNWTESESDQQRHTSNRTVTLGLIDVNKLDGQCATLEKLPVLVSLAEEAHAVTSSTGTATFTANRTGIFVICAYVVNDQNVATGAFFQSMRIPSLFVASSVVSATATADSSLQTSESSSDTDSNSSTRNSISPAAIGGIVGGVLVLLLVTAALIYYVIRRRRHRKRFQRQSVFAIDPFGGNRKGGAGDDVPPQVVVHSDSGWRPGGEVDVPPAYTEPFGKGGAFGFEIHVPSTVRALEPTRYNWTITYSLDPPNITVALLDQSVVSDCDKALAQNITSLTKTWVGPNRVPSLPLSDETGIKWSTDKPGTFFVCAVSQPPSQPNLNKVVYESPKIDSVFAQTVIVSQTASQAATTGAVGSVSQPSGTTSESDVGLSKAAIAGIVIGTSFGVSIAGILIWLFIRHRRRRRIAGSFTEYTVDPFLGSNKLAKERALEEANPSINGQVRSEVIEMPPSYTSAL
ncbi:hypothetical protein VNI00_014214 [Paramarasmius palmivorus]|uniref:Mid2 domain-containing protein n=1 Tax=Paramarasmius palmivorus TaxID=297713 RepID=A0AAW0BUA5_9AGAR